MTITFDEDDVEAYLEATDEDAPVEPRVDTILARLVARVKAASTGTEKLREKKNVEEALARLADETGDPEAIIAHVEQEANDTAQKTGQSIKTGTIKNGILEKTRDAARELRETSSVEFTVDGDGIGFDRYVEEHIVRVVKIRTTDHVTNVKTRFEFDDGNAVEINDEYLYWEPFYRAVVKGSDMDLEVLPEFASKQALSLIEDDDGDITDTTSAAYELYCKHSLGPETRPWSKRGELWARAITNLVKTRGTENITPGARTQAWNKLCEKIHFARATSNLDDATQYSEVYVPDSTDEVWVPTKLVASVVEDVEIDRQDLATELAAIGVDSDHLPGDQVVDRIHQAGSHEAFWRLNATFTGTDTHSATPEPGTIVDSITAGGAGNMSSGPAAADGGVYGRDPNPDNDEEDTDDDSDNDNDDSDGESGGDGE